MKQAIVRAAATGFIALAASMSAWAQTPGQASEQLDMSGSATARTETGTARAYLARN